MEDGLIRVTYDVRKNFTECKRVATYSKMSPQNENKHLVRRFVTLTLIVMIRGRYFSAITKGHLCESRSERSGRKLACVWVCMWAATGL